MNQEHLSHIVKQPASISGQDALELEALCKKFPAFSTPFVLLARYYWQTGDYRMEEAVQQAALRVNDREWLYDFVHTTFEPENTEIAQPQETEIPISEPVESESVTNIQVDPLFAVVETITETVELETISQEIEIQIEVKIEEQTAVSNMFEPEDSENLVFDEIEALDAAVGASILGITGLDYAQANPTIENDASGEMVTDIGGLITPMSAEEDNIEPTSISIFEVEDVLANEHHAAANEYNIEQFYPTPAETVSGPPTDFYSWLGQPGTQQEEETAAEETPVSEQEPTHQQELIDRFIANNPTISRPKKEFFTPETAAKKSEHLPEQLATETLATVYLNQGNAEGAIRIYERLILKFPEKSTYFVSLIEKTRNEFNL